MEEAREDVAQDFGKHFESIASDSVMEQGKPSSSSQESIMSQMKLSERDKVTVGHIRKVHCLWDKAKREMDGVCKKAVAHPKTPSCKFKDDLEALLQEGTILDRIVMYTEIQHLAGAQLSQ